MSDFIARFKEHGEDHDESRDIEFSTTITTGDRIHFTAPKDEKAFQRKFVMALREAGFSGAQRQETGYKTNWFLNIPPDVLPYGLSAALQIVLHKFKAKPKGSDQEVPSPLADCAAFSNPGELKTTAVVAMIQGHFPRLRRHPNMEAFKGELTEYLDKWPVIEGTPALKRTQQMVGANEIEGIMKRHFGQLDDYLMKRFKNGLSKWLGTGSGTDFTAIDFSTP